MDRRVVAISLVCLPLVLATVGHAEGEAALPHSVRMFFGDDASTQMLLVWGLESETPQEIEYGHDGVTNRVAAALRPFPDFDNRRDNCLTPPIALGECVVQGGYGFVYSARLDGLVPGTTYSYRVGSELSGWSASRTFRTAPRDADASFTFTAYGDSPPSDVRSPFGGQNTSDNARLAAAANPAFQLHLGDLNYVDDSDATHVEWWRRWFAEQEDLMGNAPYMRALGNHESREPVKNWRQYYLDIMQQWNESKFPLSSFRWGDVVVVTLWSNSESANKSYHTPPEALDAELKRQDYADAKWRIVTMHAGPYAVKTIEDGVLDGHGSDCVGRALYSHIFAKRGVDLVLSGHDHNYQRSLPIHPTTGRAVTPSDPDSYSGSLGVTYVVGGSGGKASPPDEGAVVKTETAACDEDVAFNHKFENGPAHLRLQVSGHELRVESVRTDGVVQDAFTLR